MVKVFKNEDYMNLVLMIYKSSKLDTEVLIFLYNFVCDKLISGGFDLAYIDKLKMDLNIDTINKSEKTKIKNLYNTDPKMLEQILHDDKRLYFRVTLFDLLQRAYNRNF